MRCKRSTICEPKLLANSITQQRDPGALGDNDITRAKLGWRSTRAAVIKLDSLNKWLRSLTRPSAAIRGVAGAVLELGHPGLDVALADLLGRVFAYLALPRYFRWYSSYRSALRTRSLRLTRSGFRPCCSSRCLR